MLTKMISLKLLFIFGYLLMSPALAYTAIEGSCETDNIKTNELGVTKGDTRVRVMEDNLVVYKDKELSEATKITLPFDEIVKMNKRSLDTNNSVLIDKLGNTREEGLGWVSARGLLCQLQTPLLNNNLDRKVFIKTEHSKPVPVYKTSTQKTCDETNCATLSRFDWLNVYAIDEEHGRYLVSFNQQLNDDKLTLRGWIDKTQTIEWATALGLKPSDRLSENEKLEAVDISNNKKTLHIPTDKNSLAMWYAADTLMPVLSHNVEDKTYTIASTSVGVSYDRLKSVIPEVFGQLSNIDVFFVIDGTESMDPYIQEVKNWVTEFSNNLKNTLHSSASNTTDKTASVTENTSFRFGFRVYRDLAHDKTFTSCTDGICEGVSLSGACDTKNTVGKDNWNQFQTELSKVRAAQTKEAHDSDYSEKMLSGIQQTFNKDITSCSDHVKLIFVIGDHGDKNEISEELITNLKAYKKVILFFVQTQNSQPDREEAVNAYDNFKDQAQNLIQTNLKDSPHAGKKSEDFFFSLTNTKQLNKIVQEEVAKYSNARSLELIKQDLLSGNSLNEIYKRLAKKGDFPVIWFDWLNEMLCEKDNPIKQCTDAVTHDVSIFKITDDPNKVELYSWWKADNLETWVNFLSRFKELQRNNPDSIAQRKEFVEALKNALSFLVGNKNLTLDENIPLATTLQQNLQVIANALPLREKTPLLQYSINEIENPNIVRGDCELPALVNWITNIHSALARIQVNPTMKIDFTLDPNISSACAPLNDKTPIPKLTITPLQDSVSLAPVGSTVATEKSYSYGKKLESYSIFWTPFALYP